MFVENPVIGPAIVHRNQPTRPPVLQVLQFHGRVLLLLLDHLKLRQCTVRHFIGVADASAGPRLMVQLSTNRSRRNPLRHPPFRLRKLPK